MNKERKAHGLNMRVTATTRKQLKAIAKAFGVPQANVVEALINKAYSNLPKPEAQHDKRTGTADTDGPTGNARGTPAT